MSPYGMALGDPSWRRHRCALRGDRQQTTWRKAGPEAWVGVSLEILTRINKRSFEIAYAVMHTTGQAFVMSSSWLPARAERALEAIAYAWEEMRRIPAKAYRSRARTSR
jgi:hypothetical protein